MAPVLLRRPVSLTQAIWIGLAAGIVCGIAAPGLGASAAVLARVFVRLLELLVVPLVVSTLLAGIARRTDGRPLGRLLAIALLFFLVATTAAALVGTAAANLFHPGAASAIRGAAAGAPAGNVALGSTFLDTIVPVSAVQAMAANNLLGLVFFTVLFAIGVARAGEAARPVVDLAAAVAAAMLRVTGYVMWLAPIGVFGAIASSLAASGLEGLRPYLELILVAYVALGFFAVLLFAAVSRAARIPLRPFFAALGPPLLLAFSTASGTAALPGAMDGLERWGASEQVTAFVLPLGYSFNLTGTAVYLPLVTLFWAGMQGTPLSWTRQAALVAYLLVVIRGLPSVPRALFLVWGAALAQFHLPPEGAVILLGIDPVIDMARTLVNVAGNCLAVAAIDRWHARRCHAAAGSLVDRS